MASMKFDQSTVHLVQNIIDTNQDTENASNEENYIKMCNLMKHVHSNIAQNNQVSKSIFNDLHLLKLIQQYMNLYEKYNKLIFQLKSKSHLHNRPTNIQKLNCIILILRPQLDLNDSNTFKICSLVNKCKQNMSTKLMNELLSTCYDMNLTNPLSFRQYVHLKVMEEKNQQAMEMLDEIAKRSYEIEMYVNNFNN